MEVNASRARMNFLVIFLELAIVSGARAQTITYTDLLPVGATRGQINAVTDSQLGGTPGFSGQSSRRSLVASIKYIHRFESSVSLHFISQRRCWHEAGRHSQFRGD